jgi:hypothetical protein
MQSAKVWTWRSLARSAASARLRCRDVDLDDLTGRIA